MAETVSTPPPAAPAPLAEYVGMTKTQKLSALLVMLGPESAAYVLKAMPATEVDALSTEMSKLNSVPRALQDHILEIFSPVAVEAGTSVCGGVEFTRATLEKALGSFKANDVINRVAPTRIALPSMHGIAELESQQLYNLVCHEQPQTIALVLSYLPSEKAAQVSALLPVALRDQVIERLATLAPTPVEVVERVIAVLASKAGARQTRALNQTGGVKTAADILNAMDKLQSRTLLQNIERHNPKLTHAIKQKMFIFEDIITLETSTLQTVLRDVDMRDLALALKTSSERVKNLLLGSISKRAAESVREEIAFMPPPKPRDVEAAQQRIIDAARAIEASNEAAAANPEPSAETQHVAA